MMMYLKNLMNERNLTRAALSRKSGIPESTLRDILNGSTRLENCKVYTLMNLAEALEISVEDLMEHYFDEFIGNTEYDDEAIDCESEEKDKVCEEMQMIHADTPIINFYAVVNVTARALQKTPARAFIADLIEKRCVEEFLQDDMIREAMFTVGIMDYLCRKVGMKPNPIYDPLRKVCLDEPVYSLDIMRKAGNGKAFAHACLDAELEAIPELARHHIYLTEEDIHLNV